MNSIDKLAEIFSHFPGIGPRQAKRFVYFLLSKNHGSIDSLIRAIEDLKKETTQCRECMRFFNKNGRETNICSTCNDPNRDHSLLMVVPRDVDFDAVEKSGTYKGYYFVLGGSLPILDKEPEKRIRINELKHKIKDKQKNNKEIKEIILAMNANAEGENTQEYLRQELSALGGFAISELGRGLSTGSELEYADPDTLRNALIHRTK